MKSSFRPQRHSPFSLLAVVLLFSSASLFASAFVPSPQRHHVVAVAASSTTAEETSEVKTPEEEVSRFRGYLNWIRKDTKGSAGQKAGHMDKELSEMEDRWYNNSTGVSNNKKQFRYHGNVVCPDQSCYGVVAEAYAKSNMGVKGAEKASAILDRYNIQHNNDEDNFAGIVLYTTIMKAWALADDFEKARRILSGMESRYRESGDESVAPDMIAYTVYLNVLSGTKARSGRDIAAEAMKILKEMHEKVETGENVKVRPNTYTYVAVMKCLARARDFHGVDNLFDELKQRMETSPGKWKKRYQPDRLVYGTMIEIHAESGLGDKAAERADELLQELQGHFDETGDELYQPTAAIYTSVLTAHSKATSKKHVQKALTRTNEILSKCKRDEHLAKDAKLFGTAMKVKSHRSLPKGADEAESLLRAFLRTVRRPSANMYETAIVAYTSRNRPFRAQQLLDEMTRLALERKLRYPSTATLAACAKAWMRTRYAKSVAQADRLVRRIIASQIENPIRQQRNYNKIDKRLFNDQIVAWRRTGRRQAGERSEEILNLMDEAYEKTGDPAFAPSNNTFHSVIEAWGNSSHPDSGGRALALLKRFEDVSSTGETKRKVSNTVLYPAVKALVRSGNATLIGATNDIYSRMCANYLAGDRSFNLTAKTNTMFLRDFDYNPDPLAGVRGENLLRHMEEMSKKPGLSHLAPSSYEYNCVINAYSKKGQIEEGERLMAEMEVRNKNGDKNIKVTPTTNCILIVALAERNRAGDEEKRELMFSNVVDGYLDGVQTLKPDHAFFTSLLSTLGQRKKKDPSLVEKAFNILKKKRQTGLPPNDTDMGVLCKLVLNHGTLEDIDRIESMLEESENNSENKLERPPAKSVYVQAMTTCMYHDGQGAKHRGKQILQRVEDRVASGKSRLTLDRHLYHVLLSGWARSHDKDAFRETVALFKKMKASDSEAVQPVIRSYNWVIFAAGRTPSFSDQETRTKFETAMQVFTETHQSDRVQPDSLTYSNFLFVCATLLPSGEGRDKIARNVISLCSKKGAMSRLVYENLSRYFPEVLREVEKDQGIKRGVIPNQWQRKVPSDSRWRPQRRQAKSRTK